MKIHVRQEYIDKGKKSDAIGCALALAVREQTGIKISCFAQVHLYNNGLQGKLICNLNPLAFNWIIAFDRDKTSVKPTGNRRSRLGGLRASQGSGACA